MYVFEVVIFKKALNNNNNSEFAMDPVKGPGKL